MTPLHAMLERVLALSKADACIAIAWDHSTANIRWANNTSTTNGMGTSAELVVISVVDRAVGVVSSSYFPDDRLEPLVRESEAACAGKPPAHDYMPLVEAGDDPEDWTEPSEPTTVGVFAEFARELGEAFRRADAAGAKLFGFAEHSADTIYLATSTGLRRRFRKPAGSVEITAKSPDFKRSVWAGQLTGGFTDVDVAALTQGLEQRLEWSRNTVSLPPGRYEVILEPGAVADMLIYGYISATARDADEGRSVFSKPGGGNRLGEKLYPDGIEIYSDPREPGLDVPPFVVSTRSGSYSSIFDNGLLLGRTEWVRDGTLNALITPRYWAEKTDATATPFVDNLFMRGEGRSLEEMVASTERALLVTCLWYIRSVDPQTLLLTGLTRDGVFLVEGGEVKGAVNNFRYNMSPVQMLANTLEVGRAVSTLPREFGFAMTKMPPLRVADWNMSSVSEAT